ncbi:hypothetical protein [uncultured Gammaproteobacteria bacterium]|jgi:hypothetical protein|nr:hypothetical protein [uncultured Gammaproteobacteria bacterium]CAC9548450.1 hypothetical protein [uncultured Gammaproteobacteria bacterium]
MSKINQNIVKKFILLLLIMPALTMAMVAPFQLDITGKGFDIKKQLKLSDVGEGHNIINFNFHDKNNQRYNFDLQYKKLPSNRSYPTNLDITIKDNKGKKLGYLFLANNGVNALKELGVFGLMVNINGQIVDFRFAFQSNFNVSALSKERLIQDTLVPKFGFQMIRPIIAPMVDKNTRSQTYSLDSYPYAVNYTLKNINNGLVQFQHNLYQLEEGKENLLERVYFNASSLGVLRGAMYASKYFHPKDGTFKLVFYPAMGQTESSN